MYRDLVDVFILGSAYHDSRTMGSNATTNNAKNMSASFLLMTCCCGTVMLTLLKLTDTF